MQLLYCDLVEHAFDTLVANRKYFIFQMKWSHFQLDIQMMVRLICLISPPVFTFRVNILFPVQWFWIEMQIGNVSFIDVSIAIEQGEMGKMKKKNGRTYKHYISLHSVEWICFTL